MEVCIGMIGCGNIAQGKHLPGLQKAGAQVVAFYDTDRERAERVAREYGTEATVCRSVEELLAHPRVTVVHICTPNNMHAQLAVKALDAGKHVMCEKPMARTAQEAASMLEAARRNNRKLSISYQGRFRRDSMQLKQMCENGELGDIYYARAHALRRRGVPNWGVYLDSSVQGGGCLIDIGTHALDLTLWLMDNYEPDYVVGSTYREIMCRGYDANIWGRWDPNVMTQEDSAFAMVRMKNGATIMVECSWAINCRNAVEAATTLAGTRAGADLLDGLTINGAAFENLYLNRVDISGASGTSMGITCSHDPGEAEMAAWVKALRDDTPPLVLPEQAYVVTQIIDGIYESAKTGNPVFFG